VVADDVHLGSTLGKYAVTTLKGKSIGVIDDRTAYGQGVAEEFKKAVEAAGGKVAGHEFTTDKATDFNAILTTLKGKKVDVVFFGGMDAVAGPMIKQMAQLGIKAKFMGGDGICSSELPKLAGDCHEGRHGLLRGSRWRRRRSEGRHGQVPHRLQGQVQRRRAGVCPVRVRRRERDGGCHGQG
jgi:ABC-type branched-subunit amino acid transport system substrate-binding protein